MEAVSLGTSRFSDEHAVAFNERVEGDARLMRRVAGLARRFIRKYPDIRKSEDDLLQEARCAMAAGLPKFDEKRSEQSGPFLFRCAQNALVKILYAERRQCRTARAETPLYFSDGSTRDVSSPDPDPESVALARERARIEDEAVAAVRAKLSEFDQSVLDCFTNPSPALLVLVRNLAGDPEKMSRSHVALHLRVKVDDVSYSMKKIRAAAEAVMARLERERDFR